MNREFNDVISGLNFISIYGRKNFQISGVVNDSRKARKNFIYVAILGNKLNGHDYINEAIENGASAVFCSIIPKDINKNVTYVLVKNTQIAQGIIASNYYYNPSRNIDVVMVTGTNGKTTVVTLLYSLFRNLNIRVGMLTTIENKINDESHKSNLTTPDSIAINYYLNEMVKNNCKFCFMEASSHAIDQNRIVGIKIKGAILTNISHDHLDYHSNFKDYINAKKKLFDLLDTSSFALVNNDDKRSHYILQNCIAKKHTYGIKTDSDYKTKILIDSIEGLKIKIENNNIFLKLCGIFNAYNILCVYAGSCILGINKKHLLEQISKLDTPKGRFEFIKSSIGPTIVIDYAHTPDALENVLKTIHKFSLKGRIITVFGAGGNRDKSKRSLMGKIASKYSNLLVLTSDNPRNENPQDIINDIKLGINKKVKIIQNKNRKNAIEKAILEGRPEDIILIAGKGHEIYQEINGKKYPFDDKLVVEKILSLKE